MKILYFGSPIKIVNFPQYGLLFIMDETAEKQIVLVPIRYPLTAQSTQTLERAGHLVDEYDATQLLVLHVNLFQHGQNTTSREIRQAINPLIGDRPVSVRVCSGFLVEDVICEEADTTRADIIVLGQNQRPSWRQFLSRLVGNDLAIETHLRDNTDAEIEVVG